jgi:hypothetical protein
MTNLGVSDGGLKQLLEVFVTLLFVVPGLPPLCDRLSVEDEDIEEGIQQQNDVWFDRYTVKQNGLGGDIKCVRHKRWLDHDKRIVDVFLVQYVSGRESVRKYITKGSR